MTKVSLTFDQRINTELLLGQQRGDVRTISILLRILNAVHLSEEDQRACKLRAENGRFLWDKKDDWPVVEVELETADANKLHEVLAGYDQYVPSDSAWVTPLIEALAAARGK